MPSYTLAPEARIARITQEIAAAIAHAGGLVAGPIRLAGHSAGGHLVSRMACQGAPLDPALRPRLAHILSISGVHDLRPLRATKMNETLNIDEAEARAESPALLDPAPGTRLTAWVGANERPEFVRQNDLLANAWTQPGVATRAHHDPHRHHFDVIAGLTDRLHPLTRAFTGEDGWA
jgi:acetyl esterase/lipase